MFPGKVIIKSGLKNSGVRFVLRRYSAPGWQERCLAGYLTFLFLLVGSGHSADLGSNWLEIVVLGELNGLDR